VPPCFVDYKRSPSFTAQVASLKKRFPHIEQDLDEIWPLIGLDRRNNCQGESIPTFNNTVFKHRCKSSDMRKGGRDAFRIISYYHEPTNTIYPIFIHPKCDLSVLPSKEIAKLVTGFLEILGSK
jgi:hypothetical protein